MKHVILWLCGATLVASFLFGGGARQGLASDAIPQLMAVVLLGLVWSRAWPLLRGSRVVLSFLVALVMLPLIQLVPLPPSLWQMLPGRAPLSEILAAADIEPVWRSLSIASLTTSRALLMLLPAIAIFLTVMTLDSKARIQLVKIALTIGVISVPVAILQILGGHGGPFYFYEITNPGKGVGFFANSNHSAAFYYALIPLAAAGLTGHRSDAHIAPLLGVSALTLAFILGLALTGSRSAVILGVLSLLLTLWLVLRPILALLGKTSIVWFTLGFAAIAFELAAGMGLVAILERFERQEFAQDARWLDAQNTLAMIRTYFPWGAGFGTFRDVMQFNEPIATLGNTIANRAHNDWLEILYEGGMFAGVLALVFLVWLVICSITVMRDKFTPEGRLARGGVIVLWLLLIHSVWDYPLRTIALSTLFGFCLALQFKPGRQSLLPVGPSKFDS